MRILRALPLIHSIFYHQYGHKCYGSSVTNRTLSPISLYFLATPIIINKIDDLSLTFNIRESRLQIIICSKETINPYQMRHMPYASPMMPMSIPDPAFLKRKVSLANDAGDDHLAYCYRLVISA